ncbi:MAG: histidine phosphatase family protein [Pirellulales bacterium]
MRHGATDNNLANPPRLQGQRSDPGLSGEGRRQALRTAAFLAEVPFAAVYSSPLARARETAELIARPHNLPIQIVEELTECDAGRWDGRDWPEIERTEPEACRLFQADPAIHPYPEGENFSQVESRVVPAIGLLLAENPGRTIAAVTHNVVNRIFLAHLFGLALARYRAITQYNCGVNVLRHRADETRAVTINAVFHLTDGMGGDVPT